MQTGYSYTMDPAFEGQLADMSHFDAITMKQAESSAEIPFGVMVAKSGSSGRNAKLLSASSDVLAGVLMHSHEHERGENGTLGSIGLKPGTMLNIARKGRFWVRVEESVSMLDRAHVRYAGSGQKGAFRKTAVVGETIDATKQVQFMSDAAAGGLAIIEVDMTNA